MAHIRRAGIFSHCSTHGWEHPARSNRMFRHELPSGSSAKDRTGMSMAEYYRERATVYDEFYQVGRRKEDLVLLRAWLVERVPQRTILEVAAGTGHWTEAAASVAKAITATDCNPETLAIAAQRR